jgi:hypothetical protein
MRFWKLWASPRRTCDAKSAGDRRAKAASTGRRFGAHSAVGTRLRVSPVATDLRRYQGFYQRPEQDSNLRPTP